MAPPARHLRWPRLLLSMLGGLVLLLALAYVVLNQLFPPQRLAALLSEQVRQATGRDFAVRGPLSIRVLPRIGVAAQDVVLGNAPWGTRKNMLTVQHARFDIALWPLLRGQVDIASVSFDGVDLLLETDARGVGNWVMASAPKEGTAPTAAGGVSSYDLQLSQLQLRNATIGYRDGRSGKSRSARVDRLLLDTDGDAQRVDARFASGPQPLQLSGQIGRLAALARNEADWPFDLRLSGAGLDLGAKGLLRRGAPPRAVEADVAVQITDTRALAAWMGPVPALPLPAEAKGRINLAGSALRIDGLQLSLAQQRLNGRLGLQTTAPWKLDGQLSAASLDLARWLPARATAPAPGRPDDDRWLFGTQPIGLESLPELQGTLALSVDRLLAPKLPPLSKLNLQLNLTPGRVRADPLSFGLAGGQVSGGLALSQSGTAAPRLSLRLQAGELSLDELLRAADSSGYASGGQLQLRASLELAGRTPRALAAGANGELLLQLNGSTLGQGASPLGTDVLYKVLQAVTMRPDLKLSTRVDCAVLRLPLKDGVALIDRSIALETEQLAVSARGEVRFDDETLSLAFAPTPKQGLKSNPLDLARLVALKGPWRNPQVQLDPKGLLGIAATLGAATASGGVSLLAQQLLQGKAETDACRVALTGRSSSPATAAGSPPAAPPPAASATLPPPLQKTLPDALRRIFK